MREIKFRAWDKNEKIMGEVERIDFENGFNKKPAIFIRVKNKAFIDGHSWYWILHSAEYILMQYTGLKDKNEKEIYEGDIFASGVIGSICQDRSDCPLYRVVFKEGSFLGQSIPYEEEYSIYIRPEDCEVIGSIHENPELLGG